MHRRKHSSAPSHGQTSRPQQHCCELQQFRRHRHQYLDQVARTKYVGDMAPTAPARVQSPNHERRPNYQRA
ncbi:MAG: hypothetical protein EB035_07925 [Actinobacteria bacterium]|nr:hypothetical protein [Actinomycetota bacterium]